MYFPALQLHKKLGFFAYNHRIYQQNEDFRNFFHCFVHQFDLVNGDPANHDAELLAKLEANKVLGDRNMEKVCVGMNPFLIKPNMYGTLWI